MAGRNNVYESIYVSDAEAFDAFKAALAVHQLNVSKFISAIMVSATETLNRAAESGDRPDQCMFHMTKR